MWNMKKFNSVLKRLNVLAKKHFKVYGIETLFWDDGDFSMHAYYNELISNVCRIKHQIHWYEEEDIFGLQTNYDDFNIIDGAIKLEEEE